MSSSGCYFILKEQGGKMHEDKFSHQPRLFHKDPWEHWLFHFSSDSPLSICHVLYRPLQLWEWAAGCGPESLLLVAMLQSQPFYQPQIVWPLNLPESRVCTPFRVTHVRWILSFQSMSLCVLSQNVGNVPDVGSPRLATAMLWLGGKKSQVIPLNVGGVSSAKTHV